MKTGASTHLRRWMPLLFLSLALALAGCGGGGDGGGGGGDDSGDDSSGTTVEVPDLDMNFPASLTGGTSSEQQSPAQGPEEGPQCNFEGNGEGDPFQNGYFMTRFLVAQAASWLCLTDFMMSVVEEFELPDDGTPVEVGGDEDPEAPTHMSYTDEGGGLNTIRVYWDNDTENPGMYLAWLDGGSEIEGRLIIAPGTMGQGGDPGAPNAMRMDFAIDSGERSADLYFEFPDGHPARVNGFHIEVVKDESDESFVAKGFMDMAGQPFFQFDEGLDTYITATPSMRMLAVADSAGLGAAVAAFTDFGIAFPIPDGSGGHLGYYQFTKTDKYFFTGGGESEYIDKSVTAATYKGGAVFTGSFTASGVDSFLVLTSGTTAACTGTDEYTGPECVTLLEAVFNQGDWTAETDSGTDPGDWRSDATASPDYLASPYPEGFDSWDGVFDMEFNP